MSVDGLRRLVLPMSAYARHISKPHILTGMHALGAKLEPGLIIVLFYMQTGLLLQLQLRDSTRLPSEDAQRTGGTKRKLNTHIPAAITKYV